MKFDIDARSRSLPSLATSQKVWEVKTVVNQVQKTFGRIDILVNNAGIIRRGSDRDSDGRGLGRVIKSNLKGTFQLL